MAKVTMVPEAPAPEATTDQVPQAATVNRGGRPRKVRAALTAEQFEQFEQFLRSTIELAHPEEVPADLDQVPEQYRSIILDQANSARKAALDQVETIIGQFA